MKICRYIFENDEKYGIIKNNYIWNFLPEQLYENFDDNSLNPNNKIKFDPNILLAPVKKPSKIICLGLNYIDHAQETAMQLPNKPMLFSKASTSIIGPNEDIIIPKIKIKDKYTPIKFTDYEAELAVIIGKKTKKVEPEEVKNGDYILGYSILNDVSARVEQRADKQFFRGKSFDTFAPIGPWIISPDKVGDPMNLKIQSLVNNEIRQDSNTSNMNFNVFEIVSFISEGISLLPGDVIGTGTPAGVGVAMNPPISLKASDIVEIKIEKIGSLVNNVRIN